MDYIKWVAKVADVFARSEKRYQQTSLAALAVELDLIPRAGSLDRHAHQALWHAIEDLGLEVLGAKARVLAAKTWLRRMRQLTWNPVCPTKAARRPQHLTSTQDAIAAGPRATFTSPSCVLALPYGDETSLLAQS